MATSWLQLLNKVLRPLGEDEIASGTTELTDDYHKLVSSFANQIKEEIEDAHNWRTLRTQFSATVTINSTTTALTGANERCRVLRESCANAGRLLPVCWDQTDTLAPFRLTEVDIANHLSRVAYETSNGYDDIMTFCVDNAAEEVVNLLTFPPCAAQKTVEIELVNPQAWFDDDIITTNIKIPMRPLLIGTLWYCLEERGEELGINGLYTQERYMKALDDAIARDMAEQGGIDLVPV